MNKKYIYSLLTLSILLGGCQTPSNSNSSNNSQSSTPSIEDSTNKESSLVGNFEEIDDVTKLFETYATSEDYDYVCNYSCEAIQDRQYIGGWETYYMIDGIDLLMRYEDANGGIYTDYYIYDEATEQMIYYLDSGNGKYQYLDYDNEFYFDYVSYIDYFELAGIEWEDDMVFDLENQVCVPANKLAKDRVGRTIFGDNPNEYWHDVKVYWEEGFISKVEAISIYQEVTYYYTIELSDHTYVDGSVKAPTNVEEFTNPYQPYLKGKEDYTGVALTQQQIDALSIFSDEKSMNYTVDTKWAMVMDGVLYEEYYSEFKLEAENGNYHYSFNDAESSLVTYNYFLLSANAASYPVCFEDDNVDGVYNAISYGMDEYEGYVSQIYLDRVLFFALDPKDFIYDETKGYITAKDAATEDNYCTSLFYYANSYGGLRIYLKETENGSLELDKIVTSMYIADETGAAYSFVKTYTFSNINSTVIEYPEGVAI